MKKSTSRPVLDSHSPILNGPYSEPAFHYATVEDGSLDYEDARPGRRIFSPQTPQIPIGRKPQASLYDLNDFAAEYRDRLVNLLREQVGLWRSQAYPMVTSRVTRDLLNFWFQNPDRPDWKKLFFAQQEAVETAIWLNEVAHKSNAGTHILNELRLANETVEDAASVLPRIAFKMATGTGKTVVMACLILYHYFNRSEYRNDTKYADYFLLVAPGVTIRDRLGVLRVDISAPNDVDAADYYRQRQLVPTAFNELLSGLNAKLVITNFHAFEPKMLSGNKRSPLDGKIGPDGQKMTALENTAQVFKRVMPAFKPGRRLVVINDEAHHCYLPRAKGKDTDEEQSATENERAAVWFSGLRAMAARWRMTVVYDLSATPYFLSGSGWPAYSYFPWVVSDFGLIEAIEAGLVKIPFLPVEDSSQAIGEPVLRNLYESCKEGLPKKGQRTARADALKTQQDAEIATSAKTKKKSNAAATEAPPELPPLLKQALQQFYQHYASYEKGLREQGEQRKDLLSSPPVFIVVCSNTTVSKEVYKLIAGYETVGEDGKAMSVTGLLELFSNYDLQTRIRRRKPPTLLIDSDALEHSGQVNDEFKHVFGPEIQEFKREYRISQPGKSVDALTDGDLLREVVNTVGRPGKLGQHIRCVVSVGMLTEGWDANTVTHIVGVRAFGSQLLCEQVAGRALRRREYFLDPKTGKFPPEYAHIIGVPFKFFKGGQSDLPTPQDISYLRALPERSELTIEFPNLLGYKISVDAEHLRADFSGTANFVVNMTTLPASTTLGTAFSGEQRQITAELDAMRDQEVVFWAARAVIASRFRNESGTLQFDKFNDVRHIAQAWYEQKVEVVGETDPRFKRLVRYYSEIEVAASIYQGIEAASVHSNAGAEQDKTPRITALLNRYNPRGSSSYVHASTARPVYATHKSPVNYVVADTDSWEQIAAKTFEQHSAVESYVKNAFLGFEVPYVDKEGKERRYLPDFLCRVKTPQGERFNLIVEITGFAKDKELKRYYMQQRWLPAVNAQRQTMGFLPWYFVEITDIERIKNLLTDEIDRISAEVDASAERQHFMNAQMRSLQKIWDNEEDDVWNDF